ncbi:MAG: DUF3108 domain-containing protein [Acidobacteriota bacterium]
MKSNFSRFIVLLILSVSCISFVQAQTNGKNSPYTDGEVLTYEGKFSKLLLRGISVADLSFQVGKASDGKNFLVKADAKSKGTLLSLFRFSFVQNIESTIDSEKFTALKTVKRDEQGERIRNSEANFDYTEKKVTYVETDPKDAARPPRRIASDIVDETHDLISGIYSLRNMPLAVGKNFVLNISDSGLVYQIPVRVTAKETQNTVVGKVSCFRVEPEVFGKGRMIESKGNMVIWISDDNRRLPVRSQLNTNLGRIEVRLKKIEVKK